MTLAIAVDVLKSESRKFSMIFSVVSKEDGINLSTIAPFGIRPEVGTPISTAPPAASTATPVTVKGPCARAYTSPSIPRNSVSIRFPPRRLSAEPTVETFTSIRCPGLANGGTSAVTNTAARLSVCSGCCACGRPCRNCSTRWCRRGKATANQRNNHRSSEAISGVNGTG